MSGVAPSASSVARTAALCLRESAALLLALLATPAAAQEVAGFAELRGAAYAAVHGTPVALIERIRPDFSAEFAEGIVLSVTPELLLAQGRSLPDEIAARLGVERARANEVLRIDGVSDYLSVERLYLDVYGERLDLRLGRQAINWGSAFVVNPTDPFPEVLLT